MPRKKKQEETPSMTDVAQASEAAPVDGANPKKKRDVVYLVVGVKTANDIVQVIARRSTMRRAQKWLDECQGLVRSSFDHVQIYKAKLVSTV